MKTRIKRTYICKGVENWDLSMDIPTNYWPEAGDVGIFEVIHIGKHYNVQSDSKHKIAIVQGDNIMAVFGTRYATSQFEGYVPKHVNQELHILGAGGIIGVIESMHEKYKDIGPTKMRIVGLALDRDGRVINTKKMMQPTLVPFSGKAPSATRVILSLGSSMDSGKTTTAAYLVRGLKNAGMNVAYVKLTGTVYTKDADFAWDLGADAIADFGDYGFPSTYLCTQEELLSLYETLMAKVLPCQPDYVIVEIADGLYQRETKMLLTNYQFISTVEKVIFSAGDSLAAINGINLLNTWGIQPFLLSGLLTASPLLIKEVQENTKVPVFTIEELANWEKISILFAKSTDATTVNIRAAV